MVNAGRPADLLKRDGLLRGVGLFQPARPQKNGLDPGGPYLVGVGMAAEDPGLRGQPAGREDRAQGLGDRTLVGQRVAGIDVGDADVGFTAFAIAAAVAEKRLHLDQTVANVISMRLASHEQCIDCHRKRLAQNQDAGPAFCGGCHDAGLQKKIQKLKDVPRLMRGQPDVTLIQAVKSDGQKVEPFTRMSVAPFNHIGHETYNNTCRACHHSSMDACGKCHTLQGSKDGKFVNLRTAMHRVSAQASCMGCHDAFQADKRCAGCHASMPRKDWPELAGCGSCHMPKPAAVTPQTEPKAMAAMLLEARKPVTATYSDEDIPETVEIKTLSKQFEPAKLPHRKIVQTLVKNLKDSKLAGSFHRDPGTICQGCHHNSPVAKKPPACASCHGQPFDGRNLFKPGLQAAYHLQCMECHKDMGIEKPVATNCTGCHKEKL